VRGRLFLLALAISSSAAAQPPSAPLEAARRQYDQGKYAEAAESFRDVLRALPQSQAAMAGLGESLVALNHPVDAVPYLQRAVSLDPSDRTATRELARAFVDVNDFSRAEDLLNRITETTPSDAAAWFLYGQLLYQGGYYGGAVAHLERALRLAPNAPWTTRAEVYRAVGLQKLSDPRAEAALREASTKAAARHDPDLQLTFAELLYETGRIDEALARIDESLASDPKLTIGYFWRARVLLQLGRIAEAASAAEQSIRLFPQLPIAHNLLMKIYLMQGRTREANEQAQWLREFQQRLESR
jgi:tetratricopeptide (TPR) repeat protein